MEQNKNQLREETIEFALKETNDSTIKSIKIVSNTGYCSLEYSCRQQLTISLTGRTYFKRENPYIPGEYSLKKQVFIGKERAADILKKVYDFYMTDFNYSWDIIDDGGDYETTMKFEDGKSIKFYSHLGYEKNCAENVLSDYIREIVEIEDLMLLDGFDSSWGNE